MGVSPGGAGTRGPRTAERAGLISLKREKA